MVASCCVNKCHNRQDRETDRRFFSIPTVSTHKGADLFNLTTRRRRAWLAVLRLKGFRFDTKPRRFVCSDHFVKGCPAYIRLVNDPDWKPSLKLGHEDGEQNDRSEKWKQQATVMGQPEAGCHNAKSTSELDMLTQQHSGDAGCDVMAACHLLTHQNVVKPAAHKTSAITLCENIKTEPVSYDYETPQPWGNIKTEPVSYDYDTPQPWETTETEPASDDYDAPQPWENTNAGPDSHQAFNESCENAENEPGSCKTSQHLRTCLKIQNESAEAPEAEVNEAWKAGAHCPVKRETVACTSVASLQQENPGSSPCPVRQEGNVKDWGEGQSAWAPGSEQKRTTALTTSNAPEPRPTPYPHFPEFPQTPGNTGPTPVMLVANLGRLLLAPSSSLDSEQAGRRRKRAASAQQYLCSVCSKAFNRPSKLKAHMLIHTDEKPFVCDVCNKAFKQACNLKAHKLIHTSQRSSVCDVCGEDFPDSTALRTHKLIHADHRPFACDLCSLAFSQADKLKRHKLIHARPKTFVCDVCREAFDKASSLKRHKLNHTGQMPFECDVCGRGFRAGSNLKRHKLIHTGKKPYACDVCSKAFSQASALKTHKLIHTGQKPFVCDVCNKAFNQSCNLKTHKLTHMGLKPFVCDVCNKAYSRADHLKTHKLSH